MIDRLSIHGLDYRDIIHDACSMRQKVLVDPGSMLAEALKLKHGSHAGKGLLPAGHAGYTLTLANRIRQFLTMDFP